MLKYIFFWLKSSNEHGVHSPFVFNYLTKGIYKQHFTNFKNNPKIHWLVKTIEYFHISKIYSNDSNLNNELKNYSSLLVDNSSEANLLVFNSNSISFSELDKIVRKLETHQYLILINDNYDKNFQNYIKKHKEIIVSLDFYFATFISKRTEQKKEHFYLRA